MKEDKGAGGIEGDTLNCFKCELFRVRGVADKEKQLIVSHEVNLALLESTGGGPSGQRSPLFPNGWNKEESRKVITEEFGSCFKSLFATDRLILDCEF